MLIAQETLEVDISQFEIEVRFMRLVLWSHYLHRHTCLTESEWRYSHSL